MRSSLRATQRPRRAGLPDLDVRACRSFRPPGKFAVSLRRGRISRTDRRDARAGIRDRAGNPAARRGALGDGHTRNFHGHPSGRDLVLGRPGPLGGHRDPRGDRPCAELVRKRRSISARRDRGHNVSCAGRLVRRPARRPGRGRLPLFQEAKARSRGRHAPRRCHADFRRADPDHVAWADPRRRARLGETQRCMAAAHPGALAHGAGPRRGVRLRQLRLVRDHDAPPGRRTPLRIGRPPHLVASRSPGWNALEASGAFIALGGCLLVFFFRGNLPYSNLRAYGWYHAIPQIGSDPLCRGLVDRAQLPRRPVE